MSLTWTDYSLSAQTIDEMSDRTQAYLKGLNTESRQALRFQLMVEELLLRLRERFGDGVEIGYGCGKRGGRQLLQLRYAGEPFDPTQQSEQDDWDSLFLNTLGISPVWSFRHRMNTVTLTVADRPPRGSLFRILTGAVLGTALGVAGRLMPETLWTTLDSSLLSPTMEAFLGLLNTFAGFMVALTICSGILGVGDTSSLSKIGKRVLLRFSVMMLFYTVAGLCISLPFLRLNWVAGGQGGGVQLQEISKMIFDIIPRNPIDPFLTGNMIQVIVIAICLGAALLSMMDRTEHLRTSLMEGTQLLQRLISSVCNLIPIFVFAAIAHLIGSSGAGVVLQIWKLLFIYFAATFIMAAVSLLVTAAITHCSPLLLLKKILPPCLVGFSCASSISVFTLCLETCEKKLGIDSPFVRFCYPLGMVVYMPSTTIYLITLCFFFTEIYQIPVNLSWVLTAIITVTLLTMAVPPIPSAGMLLFTILFSQLGIPPEAFVLAVASELLSDYTDTGFNIMGMLLEVTRTGHSMHLVDESVLLRSDEH